MWFRIIKYHSFFALDSSSNREERVVFFHLRIVELMGNSSSSRDRIEKEESECSTFKFCRQKCLNIFKAVSSY